MPIHPTAVIDKHAEIDATADIGPYAIIERGVKIGAGTRIWPHAFIGEGTTIGERCKIHPFAVVGHHPQDLAWKETPSYTVIGDETVIREHASVHRGTPPETTTVLGKRCFLMSTAHVAHNCVLGDDVKMSNGSMLGGHVHVGDKVFVSSAGVHQFARIGEMAMLGGLSRVAGDVPPFVTVMPAGVIGLNVIGLRRNGISADQIAELRSLYKMIYRSGRVMRAAIGEAATIAKTVAGRRFVEFLQAPSKRPLLRYFGRDGRDGGGADE